MKIIDVKLRNLLSFGPSEEVFGPEGPLTVVVGPNAGGKTNLFRAIEFVGDVFISRRSEIDEFLYRFDQDSRLEIRVKVRLSKAEAQGAVDLLLASAGSEVRFSNQGNIDMNRAQSIAQQLLTGVRPLLTRVFASELTYCVRYAGNRNPGLEYYVEVHIGRTTFYIGQNGLTSSNNVFTGFEPINLGEGLALEFEKRNPGSITLAPRRRTVSRGDLDSFASKLTMTWLEKFLSPKGELPVALSAMAFELNALNARPGEETERLSNLRRFIRLRGGGVGLASLRWILGLIYDSSIVRLSDFRSAPLAEQLPPIDSIPVFASPLDGRRLPSLLYALKNGSDYQSRVRFWSIAQTFFELVGNRVDVVVQRARPDILRSSPGQILAGRANAPTTPIEWDSPEIRFSNQEVETSAQFAAAGLFELLLVLGVVIGRTDCVVLLDEPALNLHPTRQRDLVRAIVASGKRQRNQTVMITHSPFMIDSARLPSVVRAYYRDKATRLRYLATTEPRALATTAKFIERFPELRAALFSSRVLVVEGADELAALRIWLPKCAEEEGIDLSDTELVDAGGKDNLPVFAKILGSWDVPFRLIGDSKSRDAVKDYKANSVLYPFDDFALLLDRYCHQSLNRAVREIGSRNGMKDPSVSRRVATECPPPAPIRKLWNRLKPFILAG